MKHDDATNSGGRTPGSQTPRRPRHPFPHLMVGANPGPVPVHKAPPTPTNELPHEAVDNGARQTPPRRHMWNSLDLHNRDVDHLDNEKLGNLSDVLNSLDHVDLPLRQQDVDAQQRDMDHLVHGQLGNLYGNLNSMDHKIGQSLCHNRMSTTLEMSNICGDVNRPQDPRSTST